MILEGDNSVIQAIKEKKRLMDEGKSHDHIQPLLIIDGGLMKGVYGTGAAIAFTEKSLFDTFTAIVGISAGAVVTAYSLAGQAKLGATMMWDELCTKEFWNPFNIRSPLNAGFMTDILKGRTGKQLLQSTVLNHKVPFYIGLSEYETARPVIFLPKNSDELIMGIQASISMPGAVSEKVFINNIRYVDGASTIPHILEHAINQLPSTHVLIITNQDKETASIPWYEKFLCHTIFRYRFSKALLSASNKRRETRHQYLERLLKNKNITSAVIWGNGKIGSFERNPEKIKNSIEDSRQWWLNLFN